MSPPAFPRPSTDRARTPGVGPVAAIVGALAIVAAATWIGLHLGTVLPPAYVVSVFLVAVLAAAAFFGPMSGLLAAFVAFFAFDFGFVEPKGTFAVDDPREVFALGVFLVAAIVTGSLAGRLREAADEARQRADTLAMLKDFAERIGATGDGDAIRSLVVRHVAARVDGAVALHDRDGAGRVRTDGWPEATAPDAAEARAIAAIFAEARPAARTIGERRLRPLVAADGVIAVIGLAATVREEDDPGLTALLEQAAIALERARLAEERASATAAAEQERLRSALLSSISHDLRTPLATILGSVTSLRQLGDRMEPEDRADLLEAIEEETDRLSRFVGDLLVLTRLEAGLDVRRDWIDPGDTAVAAAEHLRRVHPDRTVRATRPAGGATVRGDAILLEQVIFNLGANAAEASPPHTPIDIDVRRDGEAVVIGVTDVGRGMSAEEIARLFEKRLPETSGGGGKRLGGLGLEIATRVVAAMGGTISAESRTTAVPGTRVTIRLAAEPLETPAETGGPQT